MAGQQRLAQTTLPLWQSGVVDDDPTLHGVGVRLRALRRDRDVTLAELSQATGISVSTLSRLESGGRKPTLELLLPLARHYTVTLDDLVNAPATGDPRVHLRPTTSDGATMVPLSRRTDGIQAYKMVLDRRRAVDPGAELKTHDGYEWLYVIEGRLRLLLGEHDILLEPGEAAEFDTRVPHAFGPADDDVVELICLFGTQGERAHLRAGPRRRQRD